MIPTRPDETPTLIFNPSKHDFRRSRADENNIQHEYVLPSRKIVTFPKYIADWLAKQLAQKLALENPIVITSEGSIRLHYDERVKLQLEKIYIKI